MGLTITRREGMDDPREWSSRADIPGKLKGERSVCTPRMSSRLRSSTGAIAMQRAFACISKRFHPLSPQCDQQDQESPAPHTPQFTAAHTSGFGCSKRAPTPRERLRRISQANMYTYTASHIGSHAGRGQARRLHTRTAARHHQARRLHGGRTHTSDRHTRDTQDGRRGTTHSA